MNPDLSDVENAVMDVLWKDEIHSVIFKGQYQCTESLVRIANMTAWAVRLANKEERRAYLRWLEYFRRKYEKRLLELAAEKRASSTKVSVFPYTAP